jgi:Zn-dependent protease/ribosomal protein L37AE/L43A
MPTRQGSIHLFRFHGIDLFLHWSWFVVALFEIRGRMGGYSSVRWNALEYLALFLIVTLHEFGHALACRQVGGRANQIVLWPLGGVAYVDPPPRPGATLWSIAAGPLVNVALLPILGLLYLSSGTPARATSIQDIHSLFYAVFWINVGLLGFNMLPIFPLDGGQILRSLLWFVLGRARSLLVAVIVGFVGAAGLVGLALLQYLVRPTSYSAWLGILAVFMLLNCWGGLQHARVLLRFAKLARRDGFVCPECKTAPPVGELWKCGQCGQAFDTFQSGAVCPRCGMRYPVTRCLDCGRGHPMSEWAEAALVAPRL